MKTMLTLLALTICGAMTLRAADAEKPKKPGAEGKKGNPEEMLKKMDTNNDGSVSKEEFLASPIGQKDKDRAEKMFAAKDKNKDGKLDKEEFAARPEGKPGKPGEAPKKPADAPAKPAEAPAKAADK